MPSFRKVFFHGDKENERELEGREDCQHEVKDCLCAGNVIQAAFTVFTVMSSVIQCTHGSDGWKTYRMRFSLTNSCFWFSLNVCDDLCDVRYISAATAEE